MGVYPLKRWSRNLGIAFLLVGGGLVAWPLLQGNATNTGRLIANGVGLFIAGVFALTTRLRVGSEKCTSEMLGFSRGVHFSDITALRLYSELLSKPNALSLTITFERDGRKGKRTISNINLYDDYEQFIREVEMFSGKKVEKI